MRDNLVIIEGTKLFTKQISLVIQIETLMEILREKGI